MVIAQKIGKWLLISIAGLIAVYLIGVNSLLNWSVGQRLLNSHPEVVRIGFSHAWTIWPGRLHLRNADISGQDSQTQFAITAEKAEITFTMAGIGTKDVTGTKVHGDGITLRIRRRVLRMPSPKEMAKLPEIKGFPSPLKEDAPDVRVIGVRLEDVKGQHVREIWVDGFRMIGDVEAAGGLYYKPRRAVAVFPSTIQIHDGNLTAGEQKVASQLRGVIAVHVNQLDLQKLDQRALGEVSLVSDVQLTLDNVRFLNDLLGRKHGITISEGRSAVALAVKLDHGILREGSRLQLAMPRIQLALPHLDAHSALDLAVKVDADQKYATFSAEFSATVINENTKGKTLLRGKRIRVHGNTEDLDLTHPPKIDLRADLAELTAGNLAVVNELLPSAIPADIEGGSATINGHLHLNSAKERADGEIDIEGSNLSVKNNSAHLQGGLRLHAQLKRLDLKSLGTDLSTSWIALQDLNITYGGKNTQHWEGRIDLDHAVLHPQGKHKLDMILKVYLKNLQPAVGVIAANIKIPSIAQSLSNRENVRIAARVQMSDTTLAIPQIEVKNDGFGVMGQVLVSGLRKKDQHANGFILIKLGILPIGIDITDNAVKPVLVLPERWYDERMKASTLANTDNPQQP